MATKTNTSINGQKYYRITRTIGHEIIDGTKKPIKKQFYGPSKTAAVKKYQDYLIEQERLKTPAVDSNKPMGVLLDYFMDNVFLTDSQYAESTKDRYGRAVRQFKKQDTTGLLKIPMQAVTSQDIQAAYNKLPVALSTVQAVNKLFRMFFKWAVYNRYCTNVLDAVTIPVKPYTKYKDGIVIWTDEELDQIDRALKDHKLRLMVFLGRYAGMRISEVLGLRYDDITADTIKIRRQYYRGDVTDPKYGSQRDVPLHATLKKEIEIHRAWHRAEMKKNGYKTDYVFTTAIGTMYDYSNIKHRLKRIYEQNGIEPKSFHTYRATFCTNLCKAGVPIQTASVLMGHKSVDVTARFYTFVDQQAKKTAIDLLT